MFLFTDLDKITAQTADQAFGPLPGDENNTFRVTNKFRLQSGAKAYMPMRGDVAIIPLDYDATKPYVNAIIKLHFNQSPSYTQAVYIIYRGLLKSSFLDVNDKLKPRSTNQLLTRAWEMWDEDRKRPDSQAPASGPESSAIGWASRALAGPTERLDTLFGSGRHAVGLPTLNAGQVIGTFASDIDVSVDIILAEPLMIPTLKTAYNGDNLVSISAAQAAATAPLQKPDEKLERAQIMAYLDISTFYAISAKDEEMEFFHASAVKSFKTGDINYLYNNIFLKFAGCNTIYLDLRNEVSLPLNHYNEYRQFDETTVFFCSLDNAAGMAPYPENWPWPLYIVKNATTNPSRIRLAFPIIRNPDPLVYREYGTLSKELRKALGDQEEFISLYNDAYTDLSRIRSEEIVFELPLVTLTGGGSAILGSAIKMMVLRRTTGIVQTPDNVTHFTNAGNGPVRTQYLDNVFGPIKSLAGEPARIRTAKRWICQGDLKSQKVVGAIVQVYRNYDDTHVNFTASVLASYASVAFDDATKAGLQLSEFGKAMQRTSATNQYDLAEFGEAWEKSTLGRDMRRVQVDAGPLTSRTILLRWGDLPQPETSLSLSFARQEYESLLAQTTSFDLSLGDVYCYFRPLTEENVVPNTPQSVAAKVISTTLTLGGYVASAVKNYYKVLGPGQMAFQERFFSLDYRNFATEASSGLSALPLVAPPIEDYTIKDFVADLRTVENVYADRDTRLDQTVTRQRVHFYGYINEDDTGGLSEEGRQYIFNLFVPGSDYWEQDPASIFTCGTVLHNAPPVSFFPGCRVRQMYSNDAGMSLGLVQRLSGDKFNGHTATVRGLHRGATRLIDPGNNILDIGHAVYTLDALFTRPPFQRPRTDEPHPSLGFQNLGVGGVDLCTFMGDLTVATGRAYDAYHNGTDEFRALHTTQELFDIEYAGSSSITDLYSDADGYGLHETWVKVFKKDVNIKYSDLIRRYYNEYVDEEYTYKNRWKIACLRNNFIHFDASKGKYVWKPDMDDLRHRLQQGHKVGYMVSAHPEMLGGYLVTAYLQVEATNLNPVSLFVLERFIKDITPADTEHVLRKFLTQVRALLELEQPGKITTP
jgi:hypothetical protein